MRTLTSGTAAFADAINSKNKAKHPVLSTNSLSLEIKNILHHLTTIRGKTMEVF